MPPQKTKRRSMNPRQAELIRAYDVVPKERTGQLEMIGIMGYHTLKGGGLLKYCSDDQVAAVAHRIYEQAKRMEPLYRKAGAVSAVREYWEERLYEMFNIPEKQRKDVSPAELEERLLE